MSAKEKFEEERAKVSANVDKYTSKADDFTDDPFGENAAAEEPEPEPAPEPSADENGSGSEKLSSDWIGFLKSVVHYFLLTLIIAVLGSNFIYLTTRSSDDKDIMLPTDDLFYTASQIEGERTGPSSNVGCNITHSKTTPVWEDNFPYSLIVSQEGMTPEQIKALGFSTRLRSWFGATVAGCFKFNRNLLKNFLTYFKENTPLGNHIFQIFIAMPLTVAFSFIGIFTGLFAAFSSAIGADVKISIIGFFLVYIWPVTFGMAFIIFLRLLATLALLPMLQNWKEVATILSCNAKPFVIFFAAFVFMSATKFLDSTTATMMGIVYFGLVGYTVWKFFTNKPEQ